MSIKPSAGSEIRTLVEALGAGDEIKKEAAIARLAVIGGRAIERLTRLFDQPTTGRDTRVAILRVLERTADPRTLAVAVRGLDAGGDVAIAAAAALRPLLTAATADTSAKALDALVRVALDHDSEHRVRSAAVDALQDMPQDVRDKVSRALGRTPESRDDSTWRDMLDGHLPDEPATCREAVEAHAERAPLNDLQRLVDATKRREQAATGASGGLQWRAVRGALHQALALRHSTVALYDLRETLAQSQQPLPATFVAALHAVGDESCLEPIAAAFSRASADARWRHQLRAAFHAIVARERIKQTSAVSKRIAKRWPDAAAALSTPSRTTARRTTRART